MGEQDQDYKKELMNEILNDTCDLPVMKFLTPEGFDQIFDRLIRKGWRKDREK